MSLKASRGVTVSHMPVLPDSVAGAMGPSLNLLPVPLDAGMTDAERKKAKHVTMGGALLFSSISAENGLTNTPFSADLLRRGVRRQLKSPLERQELVSSLFSMSPYEAGKRIEEAFNAVCLDPGVDKKGRPKKAPKKPPKLLKLDKYCLTFGVAPDAEAPLGQLLTEKVVLTNLGTQALEFSVVVSPAQRTHQIGVSPLKGSIRKGEFFSIEVTLTLNATMLLRDVVFIDVTGVGRLYLPLSLRSKAAVFGVDFAQLPCHKDAGEGGRDDGVPNALMLLRRTLEACGGLRDEGIFRVAAEDSETTRLIRMLNRNETNLVGFSASALASVIKIWFRELPSPILAQVNRQLVIQKCSDDPLTIVSSLPAPERRLFTWLQELLVDVALHEEQNRMNARSLAIVVSPNLFRMDAGGDMMENMQFSQKVAIFMQKHLEILLAKRKGTI